MGASTDDPQAPISLDGLSLDPSWVAALRRVVNAEGRSSDSDQSAQDLLDDLTAATVLRTRLGDLIDQLMLAATDHSATQREIAKAVGASSHATIERHLDRIREGKPRRRPSGWYRDQHGGSERP